MYTSELGGYVIAFFLWNSPRNRYARISCVRRSLRLGAALGCWASIPASRRLRRLHKTTDRVRTGY